MHLEAGCRTGQVICRASQIRTRAFNGNRFRAHASRGYVPVAFDAHS